MKLQSFILKLYVSASFKLLYVDKRQKSSFYIINSDSFSETENKYVEMTLKLQQIPSF